MSLRPACLACITVMASLVATGCGETTIDSEKAQSFISKTVSEQAGVKVKSVTCPDDIKGEKGGTFTCVVTATDGTKGDVKVVQRDDEGNVRVSAPFLHVREAETSIADEIKKQTDAVVTVTCPEIIVPAKDATFDCEGSDGSKTRKIVLTTTNTSGAFTFKVQ
jgi:hypothetical protein